jgi:DNA-binding LacI/PurR family transcriptional regulator
VTAHRPERAPVPARFVTADDVAKLAGVSRSAVSRTFTPGASVSPEMRRRVIGAAQALGYRVNRLAQGLISAQSNLVGVVGANLATPYMAGQLDLLSRALLGRGMQCMLLNAAGSERNVAPLIDLILEFRVRAIVVMSGSPPSAIVEECVSNGVRVILVNKIVAGATADTIFTDDETGARLAAERLLAAGCRRIAVVSSGSGTSSLKARATSFGRIASAAGAALVEWAQGTTSYETGSLAARDVLADRSIDGAFCVTDLLALGFLDAARSERGRRIPDDLSVVGFDDIPQAAWSAYRLTTIRQSLQAIADAVIAAIDAEGSETTTITIPVELIERATAARACA